MGSVGEKLMVDVALYETYQALCEENGIFPKGLVEFHSNSMLTHVISILRMIPMHDDVPDIRNER
jgi:hypothetical protein